MSSKKNKQLDRVWEQAQAQVQAQQAQPGLEAAEREGVAELIERKAKGGDFTGKEIRAAKDEFNPRISEKNRHLAIKAAENGDAISDLSAVLPAGQAINAIDSKRGSRAARGHNKLDM